ncbi:MAG: hypothetical protein EOO75_19020 [Myxococcales bacterium]|nr:MAG: hypothetical protein EOO75_19020 [Myxococcales bacterium]
MLILAEDADESVARRLEAELEMLGLRAVLERPDDRDGESVHRSLPALARQRRAMAALRLVPSEGRVQLWLSDRVTGKTTLREVSMPSGPDAAELLALRAVELLRASLLELRIVVRPGGEIPAPVAAERLAGPSESWTPSVWLGPALAWSPGGTGASLHPLLGLRWLLDGRIGPEVLALLPMGSTRLASAEGSAEVSRLVVSAGLRVEFPLSARTALSFGAGGGLASLTTEGAARDGYVGTTSTTRSALLHGAFGASVAPTKNLRLGLETLAAATSSRHVIAFAGRPVGSWGRPLLVGALVAELRFP